MNAMQLSRSWRVLAAGMALPVMLGAALLGGATVSSPSDAAAVRAAVAAAAQAQVTLPVVEGYAGEPVTLAGASHARARAAERLSAAFTADATQRLLAQMDHYYESLPQSGAADERMVGTDGGILDFVIDSLIIDQAGQAAVSGSFVAWSAWTIRHADGSVENGRPANQVQFRATLVRQPNGTWLVADWTATPLV